MVANRQPIREHTGLSLGIAAAIVMFLVLLAALLVVTIYSFITVYAIVKAIGSGPTSPSGLTVLLGVVLVVTTFSLLLAGLVTLAGRAMNPKKRSGR
jgi:heme/copper-type cytochrome/quinol oxidase subunit 3